RHRGVLRYEKRCAADRQVRAARRARIDVRCIADGRAAGTTVGRSNTQPGRTARSVPRARGIGGDGRRTAAAYSRNARAGRAQTVRTARALTYGKYLASDADRGG